MLTPVDVQNKVFKGGIGFDKKDVEQFMAELASDYSELYRSNVELKDKVTTLDESLQHYRTIEESVQKSLTISEKAAEETMNAAKDKARQINIEAEKKAESIVADAKEELQNLQEEIFRLQNQHKQFVEQFKKILNAQLQLCDGKVVDIDLGEGFDSSMYSDSGYGSFGSEGGLGGGGGYTGANDERRERAAGEPAASVGSLNIDPFADAKNGGGRFSSKTSQKSSFSMSGDSGKLSLNMKAGQSANPKVKRNIPNASAGVDDVDYKEADSVKGTKNFDKAESTVKPKQQEAKKPVPDANEQARRAAEEAKQLAEKRAREEAARKLELERKAREEAALREKERAEEAARAEKRAKEKIDKELESTINAVREAARKQGEKAEQKEADSGQQQSINYYAMQQAKEKAAAKERAEKESAATASAVDSLTFEDDTLAGEVESKVDESTMLDSEDNYSTGFDFISDSESDESSFHNTGASSDRFVAGTEEETFAGEVESKIDESTMLDSEDNYSTGFDFISDSEPEESPSYNNVGTSSESFTAGAEEETFVGEVESKIDESTMLDSEDNYSTGFDFISDSEPEESPSYNDVVTSSSDYTAGTEEETFVGEVEDKVNEATMLDSEDNYSDGFDFLVEEEASEEIPVINQGLQSNFNFSIHGSESAETTTSDSSSGLNYSFSINSSASDSSESESVKGGLGIHLMGEDDSEDVFVGDVEEKVNKSNLIGNDDDEDEGFNFL